MLVDSHCHLDYPGLVEEVDAVVARAHESGVGTMLTIATRISGVESALGVAERHEGVVCAIGVHPHHATKEPVEDESDLAEVVTVVAAISATVDPESSERHQRSG